MRQSAFVYSPKFKELDLGPDHPLRPTRVVRAYQLVRACHLLEDEAVSLVSPPLVQDEDLARIHDREYIDAVLATNEGRPMPTPSRFGFGTIDNPIISGMYEAAALVTGATVLAAELVADGKATVAFNPAGGWHHAHRARAAGFCIFNDPAVAIAHLQARHGDGVRIAYLDIDAHHGDGVQEAFYHQRDVLTISLHETTSFLFPWRDGDVEDMGEGEGEGYAVNVPLAPHTPDEVYLYAFREVVLPLLEAFAPDYVVAQLGVDTHRQDPLTHMMLTTHGYLQVIDLIADRAPRLIAVGGGGYDQTVVPRAWTLAWARLIEAEPPQMIPRSQARHYREDGRNIPLPMHDPDLPAQDPREIRAACTFAEYTVAQVKELIFPRHGL